MILNVKKASKADLEAELELYKEAGVEDVADFGFLSNAGKRVAEIERLQEAHGFPVKLDEDFISQNKTLAKLLMDKGAEAGSIIFAEQVEVDEAAKLDAEAEHRAVVLDKLAENGVKMTEDEASALTTAELEAKLEESAPKGNSGKDDDAGEATLPDLVYRGKTVTRVSDVLFAGKTHKEVADIDGTTFRLTPEEFEAEVKPRT